MTQPKMVMQLFIDIVCPDCKLVMRNTCIGQCSCTNPKCELFDIVWERPSLELRQVAPARARLVRDTTAAN